jgi:hypothetical protein
MRRLLEGLVRLRARNRPIEPAGLYLSMTGQTNMKDKEIEQIIKTATGWRHDYESKTKFHRLGKRYLHELAERLGLNASEYDVRSNTAGPGCLGEVTLHSENIYLQIGGSFQWPTFYYRCVKGRRDYTGGRNTMVPYDLLRDPRELVLRLQLHLERNRHEWVRA